MGGNFSIYDPSAGKRKQVKEPGKEYCKKLYPYLTADRSVGKIQVLNQTHGGRSGWKEAEQNMKYWMLH